MYLYYSLLLQALPPIPKLEHPPTLMPSMSINDPKQSHMVTSPRTTSGNVTLVRGRTDTKNLIPEFSDIPDASVRFSQSRSNTRTSVPDMQRPLDSKTYDKLSNSKKSVSSGDLVPTSTDIYSTSGVDDANSFRKSTRLSMQGRDYSYVETEPKCVLLSPTADSKSLVLGEIRHSKSMKEKSSSVSPSIVTSDYSEADEYSSLKPVDVTSDVLPQGLYNQLDFSKGFEDEANDEALSDIPPPLPPPPILSPVIKGYENIGTHSLPRIHRNSQTGLTESAGSMEFCLDGSDSPKFTKKSKSPSVSPRQSPRMSPRPPVKVTRDSDPDRSSAPYDKVTRVKPTTSKQFEIGPSEDGATYSSLSARKHDNTRDTLITDSTTSPYSQLSHHTSTVVGENNQLSSRTKSRAEEGLVDGSTSYSTISRSNATTRQSFVSDVVGQTDNPYSTLQLHLPPTALQQAQNSNLSMQSKDLEYEHIEAVVKVGCHAYDQVDFNETENSVSATNSIYGDSIVDENSHIIQNQQPLKELPSMPQVPPRRGISMNQEAVRKPPPPPLKPKPYGSKTIINNYNGHV